MSKVDSSEFWEAKYAEGGDRWEKGEPAPPLAAFFRDSQAPTAGRALVPGCGRGHEAMMLAELSWQVTGLDFAPAPIEYASRASAERGLEMSWVTGDLFEWGAAAEREASFDLILEHTCYCAIDPERRADYAEVVADLLRPGGLLVGLFWSCGIVDGPPWTCTDDELRERFSQRFAIERLERAVGSFEGPREGAEWLLLARRS